MNFAVVFWQMTAECSCRITDSRMFRTREQLPCISFLGLTEWSMSTRIAEFGLLFCNWSANSSKSFVQEDFQDCSPYRRREFAAILKWLPLLS